MSAMGRKQTLARPMVGEDWKVVGNSSWNLAAFSLVSPATQP
jgi:hypothetical protein